MALVQALLIQVTLKAAWDDLKYIRVSEAHKGNPHTLLRFIIYRI